MYIQHIHVRCVRKWTVCSLSRVRSVFATSSPVQKDVLLSACSRDLMTWTANRFSVSIAAHLQTRTVPIPIVLYDVSYMAWVKIPLKVSVFGLFL